VSEVALGVHWMVDATGCRRSALDDPGLAGRLLLGLADDAGLTALGEPLVQRGATGLVGVLLLAESHASIHTDVASQSAFVDVFSCAGARPDRFEARVRRTLGATRLAARLVQRGPA